MTKLPPPTYTPRKIHPNQDLTGKRFNRLTVIRFVESRKKERFYECLCDCGKTKIIRSAVIKSGHSSSCGCFSAEASSIRSGTHRSSRTKAYKTWASMMQRCNNPKSPAYRYYGGRGIKVCERWHSYENFRADMGTKPTENHSIDRIDNNKGYSPENCRWATNREQAQNTRRVIILEIDGHKDNLSSWCRKFGVNMSTVKHRMRKTGEDIKQALAHYKNKSQHKQETKAE